MRKANAPIVVLFVLLIIAFIFYLLMHMGRGGSGGGQGSGEGSTSVPAQALGVAAGTVIKNVTQPEEPDLDTIRKTGNISHHCPFVIIFRYTGKGEQSEGAGYTAEISVADKKPVVITGEDGDSFNESLIAELDRIESSGNQYRYLYVFNGDAAGPSPQKQLKELAEERFTGILIEYVPGINEVKGNTNE